VPESERALYQRKASAVRDPKQKRELKIMQFKTEKDLRAKLEVSLRGISKPCEPVTYASPRLSVIGEDGVPLPQAMEIILTLFPCYFPPVLVRVRQKTKKI
jgi:hypothetical protein